MSCETRGRGKRRRTYSTIVVDPHVAAISLEHMCFQLLAHVVGDTCHCVVYSGGSIIGSIFSVALWGGLCVVRQHCWHAKTSMPVL